MTSQSALAQSAATLRAAVQSDRAPFWLPDSLHALIVACLLRIFGCLEQMIARWESGQLPAPHPRRAATRAITASCPPGRATMDGIAPARLARRARAAGDETIRTPSALPVAAAPPGAAAARPDHPHPAPPRPAITRRAPARARPPPNPQAGTPPTHAEIITI